MRNQLIKQYERGDDERDTCNFIQPVDKIYRNTVAQFIGVKGFRGIKPKLYHKYGEEHHTNLQRPVRDPVNIQGTCGSYNNGPMK